MDHTHASRLACFWLVLLAGLGMLQDRGEGGPSGEEGEGTEERAPKIVGRWQMVRAKGRDIPSSYSVIATFDKGGKHTLTLYRASKEIDLECGVYKVDGNKLIINVEGQKGTQTIKVLDEARLVTVDAKGRESELKRLK